MDAAAVRDQQRIEWKLSAPGFLTHQPEFTVPGARDIERLISLAGISPGHRVLDLACGIGVPAFILSDIVGPQGHVVGLDLSADMVAGGRARAAERGIRNLEFRAIPHETELGVPPASFDAATCRSGLQYMPEPEPAIRAVRETLRAGGRFAAMTLGPAQRCAPFRLYAEVLARHIELPAPDPDAPGPVRLPTPDLLADAFVRGGFTEVRVETIETELVRSQSPAAYWTLFEETAGPFIHLLGTLSPEVTGAIRADAIRTLRAEFGDGPVHMMVEALIAVGVNDG